MGYNYEGAVIAKALIDATKKGWRLFRNSVGLAWQGHVTEEYPLTDRGGKTVYVVELANARRVRYGLAEGSSDLVGWIPRVITPDMVGQTIAQFATVEAKTKAYGKTTEEQDNWLHQVANAGGYAAIVREGKNGEVDLYPIEAD